MYALQTELLRLERGKAIKHGRLGLWPSPYKLSNRLCFAVYYRESSLSQSPPNATSIDSSHAFPTPIKARHDSPGVIIQPGKVIRTEVDLALVNVTITDPFDRM